MATTTVCLHEGESRWLTPGGRGAARSILSPLSLPGDLTTPSSLLSPPGPSANGLGTSSVCFLHTQHSFGCRMSLYPVLMGSRV